MQDEKKLKDGNLIFKSGLRKKDCYCVLYGKDEGSPAHLACYENKESYQKDKSKSKCYYLDNIKGIDKIIRGTKNEYHLDISTKKEKILLMAESEEDLEDWYKYILAIHKGTEDIYTPGDGSFKTNILYDSSEDTSTFEVKIRPTELSENHLLKAEHYKLHITAGGLSLEDPGTYKILFHWPYEFIRKFGKKKDVFALSAGRRCESGEGELEFEIDEPEKITQAIDIKTGKKVEARKVNSEIRVSDKDSCDSNPSVSKRASEPVHDSENKQFSRENAKNKTLPTRDTRHSNVSLTPDCGLNISRVIDQDKNFKKTLEKQLSGDSSQTTSQKSEKENKENKKWGGFFGKKSKKNNKNDKTKDKATNQSDSTDPEKPNVMYEEASELQRPKMPDHQPPSVPVYDDAITLKKDNSYSSSNQTFYDSSLVPVENMYAEAGNRSDAWKHYASSGDYHEEFYDKVRDAASENKKGKKIEIEKDYEDDDDTYDKLTLSSLAKNKRQYQTTETPNHIYGITGSKAIEDIEDDYTFAEADLYHYDDCNHPDVPPKTNDDVYDEDLYDDTDLVEYDDAASTQRVLKSELRLNAYEDVDLDEENSKV